MISRDAAVGLAELARYYPVVSETGPRQSGKTTLCRATFPALPYVSLEPLDVREFAMAIRAAFWPRCPTGRSSTRCSARPISSATCSSRSTNDRRRAALSSPDRSSSR